MTVYAIQDPMRLDPKTKQLVRRFPDLAKAEEFGPLKFLLTPNAAPWDPVSIKINLDAGLIGFEDKDYLLCVGNPVLIGMATAIAAFYNAGSVTFLQWNGTARHYIPVKAQLF